MKAEIFKAYDIRGVVPEEITEQDAYSIGRAVVTFLRCGTVLVGKDMRESSPRLHAALIKGITDQGADVVDIGLCSTPLFYFAASEYEAGVMTTASHNPAKYNGFKICGKNVFPIGAESGMPQIRDLCLAGEFPAAKRKGKVSSKEIMDAYVKYNLSFSNITRFKGRKLKVVIDAGNGMAGFTFPYTFRHLDVEVIPMYFELDASFPNHEANPLKPENVKALQERVLKEKADLGIAIDGDADRCMFIDEKGEYVPADLSSALIALQMLKKNPGRRILFDLRSSHAAAEAVNQAGGEAGRCKVGHSLIKKQMRDENALFAGELSGHYYYSHIIRKGGKLFYAENSIVSSIIMLNLLCGTGKNLSELVTPLQKYHDSGEMNFEVHDKEGKMKELAALFKDGRIDWLDGVTVEYDGWWFNVRASNTEPVLRLNVEAKVKKKMEEMRDKLLKIIRG